MKKFLHEFSRYADGSVKDNGWWEIVGDRLYNINGGFHYLCDTSPNQIIVEAEDFHDLDWSCLLRPDSPYGWIDVHGKFFGCHFMEHDLLAEYYFKCSEIDLENAGFVKVYRNYDGKQSYYTQKHLTEQQEKTLIDLGVKI